MKRRVQLSSPLPIWVGILCVLAVAYLLIPLLFMAGRVPWASLLALLATDEARDALVVSLKTSVAALIIDLVLGVPTALVLSRQWRGAGLARVLVALPMSLPPVVAGIALLSALGRRSLIGATLEAFGLSISFSAIAVVMAQVFVSLPFLVVTLEAALRARPAGLEEQASSLGARPTRILFQITIPQVIPGIVRGAVLGFARCLGEFGATLTFAGSLQGVTRTLALQIYLAREADTELALALGMVLLIVAILVVGGTELVAHRQRRRFDHLIAEDDEDMAAVRSGLNVVATDDFGGATGGQAATGGKPVAVEVSGVIDQRRWDITAHFEAGRITALMGPNGAGKSTLAAVIAGQLALDRGEIRIGNTVVDSDKVFIPARQRGVAYLSQNPRIFPHLSVVDNVAFPLRARGVSRRAAYEAAQTQLRAVGLAALANRRGAELSGGQAARVALARALIFQPTVLILDEPTAALDVAASAKASRIIADRVRRASVTTILVTHDVAEALALASRMVVLDDGRVSEQGTPAAIIATPNSVFGAKIAGLNVVTGAAIAGVVRESREVTDESGPAVSHGLASLGRIVGVTAGCQSDLAETNQAVGQIAGLLAETLSAQQPVAAGNPVACLFSPDAVALSRTPLGGSPRSAVRARIVGVAEEQGIVTVRLDIGAGQLIAARLTVGAFVDLGLRLDDVVWCAIKAMQVRVIPLSASSSASGS